MAGGVVARKHIALSPKDRADVGMVHIVITWELFAIVAILLVSNAFSLLSTPSAWPYLASLVCVLGIAASNFVTIAAQRLL